MLTGQIRPADKLQKPWDTPREVSTPRFMQWSTPVRKRWSLPCPVGDEADIALAEETHGVPAKGFYGDW